MKFPFVFSFFSVSFLVYGNGIPSCCPSLTRISQDNKCVPNEENLAKENIRQDFTDNCHGQLIPISSYFTSLTYFEGIISIAPGYNLVNDDIIFKIWL